MSFKIIVYTQPSCSHCHKQLNWMAENQIKFEERSISNIIFKNEFLNMNGKGVPLTLIKDRDKTEIITGFNEELMNNKLKSR